MTNKLFLLGVRDKADLIGLNKEEDNLIAEEEVQPEHILCKSLLVKYF